MTLISLATRIHFADDVLEEALRAELEAVRSRRVLFLLEVGDQTDEIAERMRAALPLRASAEAVTARDATPSEAAMRELTRRIGAEGFDHVVAFGGPAALDLAKLVRRGTGPRVGLGALPFTAVPGVAGFAACLADYAVLRRTAGGRQLEVDRSFLPTAAICDPTLALGTSDEAAAAALAAALARGMCAALAPGFNPAADAQALEAIRRAVDVLPLLGGRDSVAMRREMMAAGLLSALSLAKGRGALHALVHGIRATLDTRPDAGADVGTLSAILLPGLLERYAAAPAPRRATLVAALGVTAPNTTDISAAVRSMRADLPLRPRLSDVGFTADQIEQATEISLADRAIGNGPRRLSASDVRGLLRDAN